MARSQEGGARPRSYAISMTDTQAQDIGSASGSRWHRWEPHIHTPGTVLNDQYKGPERWDTYVQQLERATPPIRALGITDYYSTECYERVLALKRAGKLQSCDLIFPNIETVVVNDFETACM